jgi:glucose/arabinose dehydrogenase
MERLTRSRRVAEFALLLLLSLAVELAHALPPNNPVVPTVSAAPPSTTVTCQPPTITRPQPTLPKKFTEMILFRGCLNQPTALSFSNDGTIAYVAEKGGKVWSCSLSQSSCKLVADLGSEICNDADRGLLGLAVDPLDSTKIYVLYTTPPPNGAACTNTVLTGGQLSYLSLRSADLGKETKILPSNTAAGKNWCFFFTSHSIGALVFGVDKRTLYVSAGDGASFDVADYGQLDTVCGDNGTTGGPKEGAFRSQNMSSSIIDGSIISISNPGAATQSATVVAIGLRNPFRFALNPNNASSDELFIGNVGWNTWEAIDRWTLAVQNFGWPCYEGWDPSSHNIAPQPDYQQSTNFCQLRGNVTPPLTAPYFAYAHESYVTADDTKGHTCGPRPSHGGPDQNGSVLSAIGFTNPNSSNGYPDSYKGALYFGDYLRKCIWVFPNTASQSNTPQTFAKGLEGGPVDLKSGPNGDLFYVDIVTSTIREITHK